jgi:hypothetical protein
MPWVGECQLLDPMVPSDLVAVDLGGVSAATQADEQRQAGHDHAGGRPLRRSLSAWKGFFIPFLLRS